jgi:excisionase family DNA binding protein
MPTDAPPPVGRLLRVESVAQLLSLSVRSVRALISLGKLPVVRLSARAIRVEESALLAFIAARRDGT